MNLQAAVTVYGGGPGSGCRGSNCGRPGLNKHIQRVVRQARSHYVSDCKSKGQCSLASRRLTKDLQQLGIRARTVAGVFVKKNGDAVPHSWVVVGGTIIDITADQFGLAKVHITDSKDNQYSKEMGL